jgi:hypothetical protein
VLNRRSFVVNTSVHLLSWGLGPFGVVARAIRDLPAFRLVPPARRYTTFGRSGHRAPHWSDKLPECLRDRCADQGRSDSVISRFRSLKNSFEA